MFDKTEPDIAPAVVEIFLKQTVLLMYFRSAVDDGMPWANIPPERRHCLSGDTTDAANRVHLILRHIGKCTKASGLL
jgi:hypothetical protein